jgi:L-amino acid N-acyltransferase YncA
VTDTVITFETEVPLAEEVAARIAVAQREHAWLVAEDGGRVVGYAYGGQFNARAAYAAPLHVPWVVCGSSAGWLCVKRRFVGWGQVASRCGGLQVVCGA